MLNKFYDVLRMDAHQAKQEDEMVHKSLYNLRVSHLQKILSSNYNMIILFSLPANIFSRKQFANSIEIGKFLFIVFELLFNLNNANNPISIQIQIKIFNNNDPNK